MFKGYTMAQFLADTSETSTISCGFRGVVGSYWKYSKYVIEGDTANVTMSIQAWDNRKVVPGRQLEGTVATPSELLVAAFMAVQLGEPKWLKMVVETTDGSVKLSLTNLADEVIMVCSTNLETYHVAKFLVR